MSLKIAIIGATGSVGQKMLSILSESSIKASDVRLLATPMSEGKKLSFRDSILKVESFTKCDLKSTDIVLLAAGSKFAAQYGESIAKNSIVIDNSSHFRTDEDVPLIIPQVNREKIIDYKKKNIIANPNCSIIQILVALKPLHDKFKVKRVIVSTYQSVSGAGKKAMDELYLQTKNKFMNQSMPAINFEKQIAFNVLPLIGGLYDKHDSFEEQKMRFETKKILDENVELTATCVRVPVFIGHSAAVNVEFEHKVSDTEARKILNKAEGVILMSSPNYTSPIEVVGEDAVFVSRVRKDPSNERALNMWIVSDNLRKGAALNAVQILEELVQNYI